MKIRIDNGGVRNDSLKLHQSSDSVVFSAFVASKGLAVFPCLRGDRCKVDTLKSPSQNLSIALTFPIIFTSDFDKHSEYGL